MITMNGAVLLLLTFFLGSLPGVEPNTKPFEFMTGTVPVGDLATIKVPEGWGWLKAKDAQRFLVLCGNPNDTSVMGLLLSPRQAPTTSTVGAKKGAEQNPEDEASPFFVVVSYADSGHVTDEDAAGLDYGNLLRDMQSSMPEANRQRREMGLHSVNLLGWAEPPHYDSSSKKLYWAKRLRFGDQPEETLNYCIRVLGRTGVLELNAVASMAELAAVKAATPTILTATNLNAGKRYEDFREGDKSSGLGVAALIAGGAGAAVLAKKAGLIAILFIFLKKGGFLLIIPLVAGFRWLKNRMGSGASQDDGRCKDRDEMFPRRDE